jgi:hypothetical protein
MDVVGDERDSRRLELAGESGGQKQVTTRAMKIKVNVAALITKIEARKLEMEQEYADELKEFERSSPKVKKALADAISKVAVAAKTTVPDVWSDYHNGEYITVVAIPFDSDDLPSRPPKPNLEQHERDIALLKLASDETITISTDDRFARYL